MRHDVNMTASGQAEHARLPLLGRMLALLIRDGELTVVDSRGRRSVFGNPGGRPSVTVQLHNAGLPLRLALNPYLAFGEAYVDGTLTIESGDLRQLLDLVTANMEALDEHWLGRARTWLASGMRAFTKSNDPRRSRRNVAHHYDLSGKLYDFFLDADHQYSCAYFSNGTTSLEGAQAAKKRHIAAKLLLKPGQRVLDIGCGWGGLALDLARDHGVEVTGITLSDKQLEAARERAAQAGLADRVHFELKDYRSVDGRFDRIVSVGMFEHVGPRNYREFFAKLGDLLAPKGVALLSSIGRMDPPTVPNAWIDKYIFPGGYIPSLSEAFAAVEPTRLWVTDVEILRVHYADTLKQWYDRFEARRAEAAALYDERFCRIWEFYLAACEMLFRNGPLMVFHMQLAATRDAVPLTRDYVTDFERVHRPALTALASTPEPVA